LLDLATRERDVSTSVEDKCKGKQDLHPKKVIMHKFTGVNNEENLHGQGKATNANADEELQEIGRAIVRIV
jgi:hypothetical protein